MVFLAQFYTSDFFAIDLVALDHQLQNYIADMHSRNAGLELKGISDFVRKLVETKKDIVYPLIYLLQKSALILPVVTVTIEKKVFQQ